MEEKFIDDSYSTRKGKGTLYGIERVEEHILSLIHISRVEAYNKEVSGEAERERMAAKEQAKAEQTAKEKAEQELSLIHIFSLSLSLMATRVNIQNIP